MALEDETDPQLRRDLEDSLTALRREELGQVVRCPDCLLSFYGRGSARKFFAHWALEHPRRPIP